MSMLTGLIKWRNDGQPVRSADVALPEPMQIDPDRSSARVRPGHPTDHETLTLLSPQEHARRLFDWLRGPGGRTGLIPARELAMIHREMCAAFMLEPIGWTSVGRELRRLTGTSKAYATVGKERVCVYKLDA